MFRLAQFGIGGRPGWLCWLAALLLAIAVPAPAVTGAVCAPSAAPEMACCAGSEHSAMAMTESAASTQAASVQDPLNGDCHCQVGSEPTAPIQLAQPAPAGVALSPSTADVALLLTAQSRAAHTPQAPPGLTTLSPQAVLCTFLI